MSNLCPPEVADRTDHNLRNARDMDNITSSKQYFLKSYLPSTVKLWNKLPNDIKMSQSVEIFRDKLSLHLKMCTIYKPYVYSPNKNLWTLEGLEWVSAFWMLTEENIILSKMQNAPTAQKNFLHLQYCNVYEI